MLSWSSTKVKVIQIKNSITSHSNAMLKLPILKNMFQISVLAFKRGYLGFWIGFHVIILQWLGGKIFLVFEKTKVPQKCVHKTVCHVFSCYTSHIIIVPNQDLRLLRATYHVCFQCFSSQRQLKNKITSFTSSQRMYYHSTTWIMTW